MRPLQKHDRSSASGSGTHVKRGARTANSGGGRRTNPRRRSRSLLAAGASDKHRRIFDFGVGAMLAGYAIGWLTGRFDPPFERLQMNFVAPFLDVTDLPQNSAPNVHVQDLGGGQIRQPLRRWFQRLPTGHPLKRPRFPWTRIWGKIQGPRRWREVQSRKVNGQASAEAGPLAPGQRWSAGRKRDVGAGGGVHG